MKLNYIKKTRFCMRYASNTSQIIKIHHPKIYKYGKYSKVNIDNMKEVDRLRKYYYKRNIILYIYTDDEIPTLFSRIIIFVQNIIKGFKESRGK